jgi:hypothetical protein
MFKEDEFQFTDKKTILGRLLGLIRRREGSMGVLDTSTAEKRRIISHDTSFKSNLLGLCFIQC